MVGAPFTHDVLENSPPELANVIHLGYLLYCKMQIRSPKLDEELSDEHAADFLWFRIYFYAGQASLTRFETPQFVDRMVWAWVPNAERPFDNTMITSTDIEDNRLYVRGMEEVFETMAVCLQVLKKTLTPG